MNPVNFLTRRFAKAPEGTAVLFFIQIFATLGFAVLYSTLGFYHETRASYYYYVRLLLLRQEKQGQISTLNISKTVASDM
jgi:hypothetical protein